MLIKKFLLPALYEFYVILELVVSYSQHEIILSFLDSISVFCHVPQWQPIFMVLHQCFKCNTC